MHRNPVVGLLLVASALPGGCAMLSEHRLRTAFPGAVAPGFELTGLDGAKTHLSDFKGRPVLLAFWAYG